MSCTGLAERRAILKIALVGSFPEGGQDRRAAARLCENDGQAQALDTRRLVQVVRAR